MSYIPPPASNTNNNSYLQKKDLSESYKAILILSGLIIMQFFVFILVCILTAREDKQALTLFYVYLLTYGLVVAEAFIFYRSAYFDVKNSNLKIWKYYFLLVFAPIANLGAIYFLGLIYFKFKGLDRQIDIQYKQQMQQIKKFEEISKQQQQENKPTQQHD